MADETGTAQRGHGELGGVAGGTGRPPAVAPVAIRSGTVRPGVIDAPPHGRGGLLFGRRALVHAVVGAVLVGGAAALWLTRPAMLDTDDVAATLGERIARQVGAAVTVDCPDTARKEKGETFRCTATTASGERRTVVVTITDDQGTYTWRTVQ